MILVRESGEASPDVVEYRHGLTPPMRDARKRRFRREPDLNVSIYLLFSHNLFVYGHVYIFSNLGVCGIRVSDT